MDIVEIGEEKHQVGPNNLVNSPAKTPYCWHNERSTLRMFPVVKVPHPMEETKLL